MPAAIVNITRIQRDGVRLLAAEQYLRANHGKRRHVHVNRGRRVVAAVYTTYTNRTQRGRAEGETIIIIVV